MRNPTTLLRLCALIATAFLPSSLALADAGRCRTEIVKAAGKYADARMKATARCEDAVTKGNLPPATDCASDAAVVAALANAETQLRATIDRACGGLDRACGVGGDDESLASIGWDLGACPDLTGQGCQNALASCTDIADCLLCLDGAAIDQLSTLYFASLDVPSPGGNQVIKCQRTIGKEAAKFVRKKTRALRRCWESVGKGTAMAPCPDPGDGKAPGKIVRAEARMIAKICKICGGADRRCDGDVLGAVGSGGADDLTPAVIGWAAACDDVTVPGTGSSCATGVTSLSELVTCAHCVSTFGTDCMAAATVPWSIPYPGECGGASEPCTAVVYSEDFTGTDGAPWPMPWAELAGSVDVADLQGGRARFRPTADPSYSLGRMYADMSETDVEVTFTVEFEDLSTQGVGFYVRQNGGYLTDTVPSGQGYAVFVEGFRGFEGIGVWHEENGVETAIVIDMGLALSDGVPYRVRFRVTQADATSTWLRARIWAEGSPEPVAWNVETLDSTAVLQNVAGGIALDSWSNLTSPGPIVAHTLIDDVEVTRLCNPLAGMGPVTPIAETFQFLEGPRWRPDDGVLLFTDITADTIYELTPPSNVAVFRSPANNANGLATDVNGDLLACEHQTRRVSRTDSVGTVTTVADSFSGSAFNSPNDIAVHSNGTMYFTDPRYGLPGAPELAFNGLFRRQTDGTLTVEFSGDPVNNGPNGVDLSPDESLLYMTDTETGELLAWDVAPDGSLSNQRTIASGMAVPDGTCVDTLGNIYVATWANAIEVFDASGTLWGSIPIPRAAANCGFGGGDARTLYVTAMEGLYSVSMPVPGLY